LALPDNGTAWPPKELDLILPKLREYSAWYSNATGDLADIYTKGTRSSTGVLQRLRTWFLGRKTDGQTETSSIHVSLAQEILPDQR